MLLVGDFAVGDLLFGGIVGAVLAVLATSLLQAPLDRLLFRLGTRVRTRSRVADKLDGIWKSHYEYETTGPPPSLLVDEHLVRLSTHRGGIRGKSIPFDDRSSLDLDVEIDGTMLTGVWREYTPERVYRGACQLAMSPTREELRGVWIGFAKTGEIRSGEWALRRLSSDVGARARLRLLDQADLAWRRPRGAGPAPLVRPTPYPEGQPVQGE